MLLMLRARHFLWIPGAWPGRRSETETAWQPRQPPEQKGSRESSSGRRSGQGRMRRGAAQCSAVQRAGGAERCRAVQGGSAPMLSVVCCSVSGEPVRRPAIQAAEGCSVQQQQGRADRRTGEQADSDMRAAGRSVVAGAMAEILGAGGRSSRWCRLAGLDCSLAQDDYERWYDAACNKQQAISSNETAMGASTGTMAHALTLTYRTDRFAVESQTFSASCLAEHPERSLITWPSVKVRLHGRNSSHQLHWPVLYECVLYRL